jgi:hypothetical protein
MILEFNYQTPDDNGDMVDSQLNDNCDEMSNFDQYYLDLDQEKHKAQQAFKLRTQVEGMNELINECMITPGGGDILFDVEFENQNSYQHP